MGWSSGSEVFDDVWGGIRSYVPTKLRVIAVTKIIRALEQHDWDCVEEAIRDEWPEVEEALAGLYPRFADPTQ